METKGVKKKILMAAGGTGGHIFPALRMAECIKAKDSSIEVEFVHGGSPLEHKIYATGSHVCHLFSVGRLRRNVALKERITTLCTLPFVFVRAIQLVLRVKPLVVLGTGGAVSGMVVLAAWFLQKKTVIWEPNFIPGLANRWLARFVDEVWTVFERAADYMPAKAIRRMGFPVKLFNIQNRSGFQLPLKVLIMGGSQGSSFLNGVVSDMILSNSRGDKRFVHQTGEKDFVSLKDRYRECSHVKVFSFLDVSTWYDWADVVLGRAGMGMIAELSVAKKPVILIPLAQSAGGHQLKNALFLKKHRAAMMITEKELTPDFLKTCLDGLIKDPQKMQNLAHHIHALHLGSSGGDAAEYLLSLLPGEG